MATKKKLLEAAAGSAGGAGGLNVEDVFSTYLFPPTSGTDNQIVNGIDLSGEGGMVWLKSRSTASTNHYIVDTVRGSSSGDSRKLKTNSTAAQDTGAYLDYMVFNSNGFTSKAVSGGGELGTNTYYGDMASWTFRKAPKFFDVVTYTGNGNASQTISHSLGTTVGMLIIKKTSGTGSWNVYHRGTGNNKSLELQSTDAAYNNVPWGSVTSTTFEARSDILGNDNGATYVAYLFAHNDGDGDFGPTGDQDIIKCGSYTGNGSTDGPEINLGFEPQWVLIKRADSGTAPWLLVDTMRGMPVGSADAILYPNYSNAEDGADNFIAPTATGFKIEGNLYYANTSGSTYIYIAIRRGPMAVPESATDVFALDGTYSASSPQYYSGWPVDFWMRRYDRTTTDYVIAMDRLRGNGQLYLNTTSTNAESSYSTIGVGQMDGADLNGTSNSMAWMWRRAPSFFDVVAYTGAGYNTNVKHNLGVIPELCIAKSRTTNGVVDDWYVWCSYSGDGNDTVGFLNSSGTSKLGFHASSPSSTDLYLHGNVAYSTYPYVMYLFASVDGVSKVGSYDGDSTTGRVIDCGFTSGARFVLIKRTDGAGDWYVFDVERGITASVAYSLSLNSTAAEDPTGSPTQDYHDRIDPHSSGFIVNHTAALAVNESGQSYIFYAIA